MPVAHQSRRLEFRACLHQLRVVFELARVLANLQDEIHERCDHTDSTNEVADVSECLENDFDLAASGSGSSGQRQR